MMKHRDQVLALLSKQIPNAAEVADIDRTAGEVSEQWVSPVSGGKGEINGLIYGLVQSGKTGVLTVTGAVGADEGYRTLIILTSDNNPLYDQTLNRARAAFPGMDIISKTELQDFETFVGRIKSATCVIVATKNASVLRTLVENFQKGNVKGLGCLIIDDEADQASLNTKEKKGDGSRSAINDLIGRLRDFFDKNTYLQVTATPQALFLQTPGHDFRPQFTVLSQPGYDYVGGDDFFGDESHLVREFPITELDALSPGGQPVPTTTVPASLMSALDMFIIGATYKRARDAEQNCAFLCHVSTKTSDHQHIVSVLHRYRADLASGVKERNARVIARLRDAYKDLSETHAGIRETSFDELVDAIAFFSPGISIKLVNGETDEDVAVNAPYNLFVGGNKLGRGVTIKNLLVSYYGRNPKSPNADTVLQHARMYGYRRRDIGLLRLFLPPQLHTVFRAINKMERGLRELIARRPTEDFRGVYIEGSIKATRANVLAPGSIGVYSGGSIYNPAQVMRDESVSQSTGAIDEILKKVRGKMYVEMSIADIRRIVELTRPDQSKSERVWDPAAVAESVTQFGKLHKHDSGYVYVDRDRGIKENRRETQGILDGGEASKVPDDKLTLFLLRTTASSASQPAWWPQLRFPDGPYAFAFAV